MRISGGELRGRNILVPKSDAIRPTQDRVREALFSIIQCETPGARFLDLFAGTGAVGLEALSRGARRAVFVEMSAKHVEILRRNIDAFGKSAQSEVARADAYRYIAGYCGEGFDIAFADPPNARGTRRGQAWRALHRRDDRGAEIRRNRGVGAFAGQDIRQDANLPLAQK